MKKETLINMILNKLDIKEDNRENLKIVFETLSYDDLELYYYILTID